MTNKVARKHELTVNFIGGGSKWRLLHEITITCCKEKRGPCPSISYRTRNLPIKKLTSNQLWGYLASPFYNLKPKGDTISRNTCPSLDSQRKKNATPPQPCTLSQTPRRLNARMQCTIRFSPSACPSLSSLVVYHPTTLPCPTEPMAPFPRPSNFCRAASAASSFAVLTYCPSYQ